jgi:hypothetical protein
MAVPAHAPKKPANQGGKAPANVQQPATGVPSVSNTTGMPHSYSPSHGNWQQHLVTKQPGGTRGSGKGAR